MSIIVGIDGSFTCTGLCVLDEQADTVWCREIKTTPADGHFGKRCMGIARQVVEFLDVVCPDETCSVFMEFPGGSFQGKSNNLPALFWEITNTLERDQHTIYPVSAN